MKKEARSQALKLYLKHNGKVTNRAIAEQVNVNPLTVGRWKRDDSWDDKLKEKEAAAPKEKPAGVVRKKAARDRAFALYMEAGGNITNKELANAVQVSPRRPLKRPQQKRPISTWASWRRPIRSSGSTAE